MKYPTEVNWLTATERWATWKHPSNSDPEGWLERELALLRPFIKPGDVAIDIGAYVGDNTIPMAIACGFEGVVYAYEPNPATFEVLTQNKLLNPHLQIVTYPAAVAEHDGKEIFHYSDESFCNGGKLLPVANLAVRLPFQLEVETMSFKWLPLTDPLLSFIKIDAEGQDFNLLRMMAPLLLQRRAMMPTIKVELFPDLSDEDRIAFRRLIVSLGLTPCFETDGNPAIEADFLKPTFANIICIRK